MVLDGKEADNDDDDAAEEGVELGREAEEAVAAYIDDAAGDAGHGVDLLVKDEGHLVDEDVADDSACGPGDAAHGDGSPEGEAHLESLLDADDVEEGKADGVEDEPGVLLADEVLAEDDDPEEGDEAADDVDAVGEPEGTDAKHEVAYGAAADGCGHAYDEGSEPVETLGGCHADAGDGEGHGADELDDDEGGGDAQAEGELLQEVEHDAGRGDGMLSLGHADGYPLVGYALRVGKGCVFVDIVLVEEDLGHVGGLEGAALHGLPHYGCALVEVDNLTEVDVLATGS